MMNKTAFRSLGMMLMAFSVSAAQAQTTQLPASNPFSAASKLPYQAPPFHLITNAHYQPALEAGIAQKLAEIESIANNKEQPTFANTFIALEKSGILFNRVSNVFDMVSGANTNDTLQQLQELIAPKIAALSDAMYLNTALFARVKSIYDKRDQLKLDAESKRLVEYYYQKFVMAGANLSDQDKGTIKQLNEEEALLSARYNNMLLGAGKEGALIVDDVKQLDGLSEGAIKTAAANAKDRGFDGKYLLSLKNTTQQPALSSLTDRTTRQRLFEASWNRAEKGDSNDTRKLIVRLAQIRAQKASLLGQKSYAAWKLQDQMAETPEDVSKFFSALVPAVTGKAKVEADAIQQLIDQQKGGFKLEPWDWDFYAEQVRKAKYSLDEAAIKPYFEMRTVLEKGVFYAANIMYGLTFKERKDIPVYHPDVRVYEVFDKGKPLALFYADYYKRDNKNGGAWMSNAVEQSYLLGTKPVIYNVCNFSKPANGEPALISFDDVTTMFHEFGHALHGLFADQKYVSLSGTRTARDFVEFPSQFNEHWALDPVVLKNYAIHYKTGKPIDPALIEKIKNAATFNKGYALSEAVAAANLDLAWHQLTEAEANGISDAKAFEQKALQAAGLDISYVPPRYRSTYFLHIWSNGYSAGYYAYQWTKMLEEDAYEWFKAHGGMTRANGERFRKMVLSRGNTIPLKSMFKAFAGHEPDIQAMIRQLGLMNKN